jgi:chemotaxis protein methyltransferase CheR
MNPSDLSYVQSLVHTHSAIVLDDSKAYLIDGRLTPLARKAGLASCEELIEKLRREPLGPLHRSVVEALATHETSFFRDPRVFHALRTQALPELFKRKKHLTIWSAACSTGQEPYSLAMLLLSAFPELDRRAVRIYASDLSEQVLDQARAGVYSRLELGRGLLPDFRERFFEPTGEHWRVRREVRDLIDFTRVNLVDTASRIPPADLVLMRNVLIYFAQVTRTAILERTFRNMLPDGYLVLGTSETAIDGELFSRTLTDGVVFYRALGRTARPFANG